MDTHLSRDREWSQALLPAVQALHDAHEQWHDAFEGYHDPPEFRRHLESLVQALRNTTFRLQSEKHSFPEFDSWYSQWQDLMRRDRRMRWLHEARIEIVKRSGLKSASLARVSVIDSYLPVPTKILKLPATASTAQLVAQVRSSIPKESRPNSAIEVARRWQVPDLRDGELLSTLAWCWHVLEALLIYAYETHSGDQPPESPQDFVRTVQFPPCMTVPPDALPLLIEADTGELFELAWEKHKASIPADKVIERYGFEPVSPMDDLVEYGKHLHDQARRIFMKDRYHIPLLMLRKPDGQWEIRVVLAENQRDKFVLWREIAHMIAHVGHDAYILTTEVWLAPLDDLAQTPYFRVEDHPQRREALSTSLETLEGQRASWSSEIVRFLGRSFLKGPQEWVDVEADVGGFAAPIRRVWEARRNSPVSRPN